MKVKELLEALQKFDPEAEVEVPLQTWTQRYPSGYFSITKVTHSPLYGIEQKSCPRLWVHLGEGFIISERKIKK